MHRKLTTLLAAAAIAFSGLSAPARAEPEDAAKILFGLTALALIGKAIHDRNSNDTVTQYPGHNYNYSHNPYPRPGYQPSRPGYYPSPRPTPRPVPPRFTRYDLPSQCLRYHRVNRQNFRLFGSKCLSQTYGYTNSLPYACQFRFADNKGNHVGYEPACLRQRGYRIANY